MISFLWTKRPSSCWPWQTQRKALSSTINAKALSASADFLANHYRWISRFKKKIRRGKIPSFKTREFSKRSNDVLSRITMIFSDSNLSNLIFFSFFLCENFFGALFLFFQREFWERIELEMDKIFIFFSFSFFCIYI